MGENCLLFYQELDKSFESWNQISTFDIQYEKVSQISEILIDKKIDENISAFALDLGEDHLKALVIVGLYLQLDAATLLGNSQAGEDSNWIAQCTKLRQYLKDARNFKSEKVELLKQLNLENAAAVMAALAQAVKRETKVFLIGDFAIAVGYLLARTNSQAKKFLITASVINHAQLLKAVNSVGLKVSSISTNSNRAKGLAIALLSHV